MNPKIKSAIRVKDIEIDVTFSREAFASLREYIMAVEEFTAHIGSNTSKETNEFVHEVLLPWLEQTTEAIEGG